MSASPRREPGSTASARARTRECTCKCLCVRAQTQDSQGRISCRNQLSSRTGRRHKRVNACRRAHAIVCRRARTRKCGLAHTRVNARRRARGCARTHALYVCSPVRCRLLAHARTHARARAHTHTHTHKRVPADAGGGWGGGADDRRGSGAAERALIRHLLERWGGAGRGITPRGRGRGFYRTRGRDRHLCPLPVSVPRPGHRAAGT